MMFSVLIAHSSPRIRQIFRDALQYMFEIDEALDKTCVIQKLSQKRYIAVFLDYSFAQRGSVNLLNLLNNKKVPSPECRFLVRHGRNFPFGKAARSYEGAAIVSVPNDIHAIIQALVQASATQKQRLWQSLTKLEQDVLQLQKSLFDTYFTPSAKTQLTVEVCQAGAQTIVDAAAQQTLEGLLKMLQDYDDYTFSHNLKVSSLMTLFGMAIGIREDDIKVVAQAGLLHDVGKRQTPLSILNKPGPLDEREWRIMRDHARHSVEILERIEALDERVIIVAAQHHEKLDGTGYPEGLSGARIHDLALVCALADVYSALTDKRPYKAARSSEKALEIMATMINGHLEPGLFYRFKDMIIDMRL